ncbi:flavodoxin-dependent (E)-4-hydroxy-3-methylbut-2-enyl-diphosphate synthase [Helicobacter saguini]|uniref:4-hydroxy-3-methylbut-2-en-1-yl diphosphate synthase (flavodoxin) n=1 Tax=Helicobacter saguini TaxID=1548018 RepID=A0A347VPS5_9HELI|nr:flavodoxin-dependent (E)-4-hydroxy-3-methylbut-2-enyl-diphosphate synthase [Helicobacter saguini]MWV61237.1 flavodoxin-dependent (E)-4-hydroxy-3-methylbut-2-enyl-diphosphate synthase [Helicobacter saguini]MWV68096.1 flavodoxin-dependent (E)-4-hydroxy-3-methylbut-2-enyl-diphosphate synthase [Helicobacter saguini]MWV70440.1 flavodoxin-dependent (E)-4-hydroxy-3-methylbut-2-enyl-diphosphate synthase [Helicobacter saguini]MWV72341.1 flavodoxin-dependent (E)-4-hydroxy-3-methylbut-2-enyl-diphosphat
MQSNIIKPRWKTKQIFVGNVAVGGDAPISVQSMTFSKTHNIEATKEQLDRLQLAGADIVRLAVLTEEDAHALKILKEKTTLPLVADIHFKYKLALIAAKYVDCIRINPGNIGSKDKIKEVVKACKERKIPIRIGVNGGSLEKEFETKYGATPKGMIESALYNVKLLEDFDFTDIKISLKASDAPRTIEAYQGLRPLVAYPFHLGVTEAGTLYHSMIKSSIALGNLLMQGIGDTMRCSITGELEEEIKLAKSILRYSGRQKEGITIVSCPTCGRIQADLVSAIKEVEKSLAHIKTSLTVSVMGCAVNALGEAKHADIAIAFGNKIGHIIKEGKVLAKVDEDKIVEKFVLEVEKMAKERALDV